MPDIMRAGPKQRKVLVKNVQRFTRGSLFGKRMMLSKRTEAGRKRRKTVAQLAKANKSGFKAGIR